MSKKPETLEECQEKIKEMFNLLLEARDALPAHILMTDELVELLKAAYVEGFHAAHKVFVTNNFLVQAGDKCPS